MGILRGYLEEIDNVLQNSPLSLKASNTVFDFEYLPSSIADQTYRIEVDGGESEEISRAAIEEANISIWIIWKVPVKGNRQTCYYDKIDQRELIQSELLKNFKGCKFVLTGFESKNIYNDYIVMKITAKLRYEVIYE